MKKLLVLLSTFNGDKFINEQLDSILNQVDVEIDIMIRDDGSTDKTIDILKEYNERHSNITLYLESNLGCKRSFYTLLKYAIESKKDYDYYAFSDQDDVWLDNKSIEAIRALDESDNPYKLYSSTPINVDSNLNRISQPRQFYNNDTLGSNIISNRIQGSTAYFSRDLLLVLAKAYETMMNLPVHLIPYHDAYLALAAYALSSYIVSDKKGYLLYRQHGSNLIGGSGQNIVKAQLNRLKSPYRRFTKVRILLSTIDHSLINKENLDLLQKCANANLSLSNRIKIVLDRRLRTGSYKHDIFFIVNVLLKRW